MFKIFKGQKMTNLTTDEMWTIIWAWKDYQEFDNVPSAIMEKAPPEIREGYEKIKMWERILENAIEKMTEERDVRVYHEEK